MLKLDEEKKKFIAAIGNPSRLKIMLILWKSDKELTVYKICQRTGLGRSAVTRHLGNLVDAGLITLNEKFEPGLNGVKAEVLEKFLVDLLKRRKESNA